MKKLYMKPICEVIVIKQKHGLLMSNSEVEFTENIGANSYSFEVEEDDEEDIIN